MKKPLSLLLVLSLLLCLFAGCAETAEETPVETPVEETPAESTETPVEETPAYMAELLSAMKTYADDTVVMTVDGVDITWDMFFYMLSGSLNEYAYYLGDLPADFSMEVKDGETMEDYFNKMTVDQCKLVGAVMSRAAEAGVVPAPENEETIMAEWTSLAEAYGGDEALRELTFMTPNAYLQIMRFELSNSGVQTKMYGTAGELFADEDVLSWAEENQFVRIKHILFLYQDEAGAELDEAGKAEVLAHAQAVAEELQALEGDNEALEARFDEIMNAESDDDGGLLLHPNGYTFTTGDMVAEFEAAAFALEEYTVSDVVESQYGPHVLLRLPMGPDDATMVQSGTNTTYTLRQLAISADYNTQMEQWIDEAEVVWAEGFENFSVLDLFPTRIGSGTMVNEG